MTDLFLPDSLPRNLIDIPSSIPFELSKVPAIDGWKIKLDGGELLYSDRFFSEKLRSRMVAFLQEGDGYEWRNVDWSSVPAEEIENFRFRNIKWKQDYIKLFGRTIPLPRLTSWYGDPGAVYSYSGIRSDPNPWNDGLNFVRNAIEASTDAKYNCVLLNWYRNGDDSLNWHADDERELGKHPVIASANFGAKRDFQLRRKGQKGEAITVNLNSGSLLVMQSDTQDNWEHQVPKRRNVKASRFNLTFRYIHTD